MGSESSKSRSASMMSHSTPERASNEQQSNISSSAPTESVNPINPNVLHYAAQALPKFCLKNTANARSTIDVLNDGNVVRRRVISGHDHVVMMDTAFPINSKLIVRVKSTVSFEQLENSSFNNYGFAFGVSMLEPMELFAQVDYSNEINDTGFTEQQQVHLKVSPGDLLTINRLNSGHMVVRTRDEPIIVNLTTLLDIDHIYVYFFLNGTANGFEIVEFSKGRGREIWPLAEHMFDNYGELDEFYDDERSTRDWVATMLNAAPIHGGRRPLPPVPTGCSSTNQHVPVHRVGTPVRPAPPRPPRSKRPAPSRPSLPTPPQNPNRDQDDRSCCICFEKTIDAVLMDCRHMNCCNECAIAIKKSTGQCPVCRQEIKSVLKVFVN